MKNIIIPTDFTEASYHTISYGIALAKALHTERIILYHAYQSYVPGDPDFGLVMPADVETYKALSEEGMEKVKTTFKNQLLSSIQLLCENDYNIIENGIEEAAEKYKADLVIMNLSASSGLENALFGSTAISLSKTSKTPVLIVPADAKFTQFNKALLAIDMADAEKTTPIAAIKNFLAATNAQVDVLHVALNDKNSEENFDKQVQFLKSALNSFNVQFHFEKGDHLREVINNFAAQHQSDIIIMIPKQHGWFQSIFRHSYSKEIVFHSHIPVLAIHEK